VVLLVGRRQHLALVDKVHFQSLCMINICLFAIFIYFIIF
jgi:hypothetical protein